MLHAKALHSNPFDGHTLGPVVADMARLTGVEARRSEERTRQRTAERAREHEQAAFEAA